MIYYDRTDINEGIDLSESNNSKDCMICHYRFSNDVFKFQNSVSSGYHGCHVKG